MEVVTKNVEEMEALRLIRRVPRQRCSGFG
jgi:hypothetical protein